MFLLDKKKSQSYTDLADTTQLYIFEYLVEKECVYTFEAFHAYRSLDAYYHFLSGKVSNWVHHKMDNICIVYCEIGASQATSKNY